MILDFDVHTLPKIYFLNFLLLFFISIRVPGTAEKLLINLHVVVSYCEYVH